MGNGLSSLLFSNSSHRNSGCDVLINIPSVSRQHASITIDEEGRAFLVNHSGNGTQVNTQSVQTSQPLKDKDVISIGGRSFRFLASGSNKVSLPSSGKAVPVREDVTMAFDENVSPNTPQPRPSTTKKTRSSGKTPVTVQKSKKMATPLRNAIVSARLMKTRSNGAVEVTEDKDEDVSSEEEEEEKDVEQEEKDTEESGQEGEEVYLNEEEEWDGEEEIYYDEEAGDYYEVQVTKAASSLPHLHPTPEVSLRPSEASYPNETTRNKGRFLHPGGRGREGVGKRSPPLEIRGLR